MSSTPDKHAAKQLYELLDEAREPHWQAVHERGWVHLNLRWPLDQQLAEQRKPDGVYQSWQQHLNNFRPKDLDILDINDGYIKNAITLLKVDPPAILNLIASQLSDIANFADIGRDSLFLDGLATRQHWTVKILLKLEIPAIESATKKEALTSLNQLFLPQTASQFSFTIDYRNIAIPSLRRISHELQITAQVLKASQHVEEKPAILAEPQIAAALPAMTTPATPQLPATVSEALLVLNGIGAHPFQWFYTEVKKQSDTFSSGSLKLGPSIQDEYSSDTRTEALKTMVRFGWLRDNGQPTKSRTYSKTGNLPQ